MKSKIIETIKYMTLFEKFVGVLWVIIWVWDLFTLDVPSFATDTLVLGGYVYVAYLENVVETYKKGDKDEV